MGGASLGGSDDLAAAMADGSLQAKLEEAKSNEAPALPAKLVQVRGGVCFYCPRSLCARSDKYGPSNQGPKQMRSNG